MVWVRFFVFKLVNMQTEASLFSVTLLATEFVFHLAPTHLFLNKHHFHGTKIKKRICVISQIVEIKNGLNFCKKFQSFWCKILNTGIHIWINTVYTEFIKHKADEASVLVNMLIFKLFRVILMKIKIKISQKLVLIVKFHWSTLLLTVQLYLFKSCSDNTQNCPKI